MSILVARQPVFNRYREVTAYELRFRLEDGDSSPFLSLTRERLANNKRIFVRFGAGLLDSASAASLPRNLISVEVEEEAGSVAEITQVFMQLKEKGYTIIAGDFILKPEYSRLIELTDIIKLDFSALSAGGRGLAFEAVNDGRVKCFAVNVDNNIDFEQAAGIGCTYLQGDFFIERRVIGRNDLNVSRANYMRIFSELTQADLDFGRLESVIQHDVAFCYKLLKFVNSAAFGFRETIRSIRQALVLLGKTEVMHWVSSLTLREVADNKPQELVVLSVARAKLGELLADKVGLGQRFADIFLLGIFSLIDVLLDRPLPDILNELPLNDDVKEALLGGNNQLRNLQELIFAYEKGEWEVFSRQAALLGLAEEEVPEIYCRAIEWADEFGRR